jgi:hypothetical protein
VVISLIESLHWTVVVPLPTIMELDGIASNVDPLGDAAKAAFAFVIPVPDELTMLACSYFVSIVNSSGTRKSRMVHGGPSSLCCAHLSEQKKIPWFDLPPSVWVTWMFRLSTVYPPLDENLLLIHHGSYCILSSRM